MMIKLTKLLLLSLCFLIGYATANESEQITMATTTSIDNSGLLDYLLPLFRATHNIQVKVIATGTGRALKLAERGDADVVLVHAPNKEKQFVDQGFGVNRNSFMYNYFLIVGPQHDPANIKAVNSVKTAFVKIAKQQVNFISRADKSGTHFKEQAIWQKANIVPSGAWYREVGQGMGRSLQIADELGAYLLIDQGTWLKLKNKTQLVLLYGNDSLMFNPYSIILANPDKHSNIRRYQLSKKFSSWITSKATKKIINQYQVDAQQLFFAYQ